MKDAPTYAELAAKPAEQDTWNAADYFGDDEIAGMEAEQPPFGSERHRFLSTIRAVRKAQRRLWTG